VEFHLCRINGDFIAPIRLLREGGSARQQGNRCAGLVGIAGQLVELHYGVFRQIGHRPILKLHFRPTVFGRKGGPLLNGRVYVCGNPVLSQDRRSFYPRGELHFSLNVAHPNNLWFAIFIFVRWDWSGLNHRTKQHQEGHER
jgi:hypothetical protein